MAPLPGKTVRPRRRARDRAAKGSAAGREPLAKQPLGLAQTLLGEHDRLGLADRVGDQALLVEPIHRIPVKPLPSPAAVVQAEVEQGQDRLVDPISVDLHNATTSRSGHHIALQASTNHTVVLAGCILLWSAMRPSTSASHA